MKIYLTVGWTCRLLNYESNATWMDQNGVKTKKIWPTEGSGNFVNRWNLIFELKQRKSDF